jgi:hypothetical protein
MGLPADTAPSTQRTEGLGPRPPFSRLAWPGRRCLARTLLWLAPSLSPHAAWPVDASDYLLLPTVVQGERELDWRSGNASAGPSTNGQADYALGIGYGVTAHWFTELAVHYGRRQGSTVQFRDVAWENILQLAEPGEWPLDIGVSFEVERSQRSQDQLNVTGGVLLQKDIGLIQANLNSLFTHVIEGPEPATTRIQFQAQLKYRYSEPFEFGVQAFSNVSSYRTTWAPYSNQVHRLGPVVLGKFKFGRERSLAYNAAFLLGTTDRSPDRTVRFQFEYEF